MSTPIDSPILQSIFTTPESRSIFSDETRTKQYLRFEHALAVAQTKLGIIPRLAGEAIQKTCKLGIDNHVGEVVDKDLLRKETERIGYPVLGLVRQLVKKINKDCNEAEFNHVKYGEYVHYGATTQDVTDTANVLQLQAIVTECIKPALSLICSQLQTICKDYRSTPVASRSNLQQAVPISYGFKLARILAIFLRHQQRMEEILPRVLTLEFGGAAGTLATLTATGKALECQEMLAQELNLNVPTSNLPWHTERDSLVEFSHFCTLLVSTCAKFALDFKLQTQNEVGELSEPFAPERGSSSTMPQKRNPISCAYITASATTVRHLNSAMEEAMASADFERSTGPWQTEWIALPQICILTHSVLVKTLELLEGMEVHVEAMKRNLEISKGAVVSEAVMMGLAPVMGRSRAHDLVYELCREALKQDRPLVDLLDECTEIPLERKRLEELCDSMNWLGESQTMVDRVLVHANKILPENKTPD